MIIMGGLTLDPASYRTYVRISHQYHILVEGRDDKRAFEILVDELFDRNAQPIDRFDIAIDSAESLLNFGKESNDFSNRSKVEVISNSISGTSYSERFVGFVDRDFRDFETDNIIVDLNPKHNVLERLIWSRGHSIENYFFDFESLYYPLRAFSVTDHYRDALILLTRHWRNYTFNKKIIVQQLVMRRTPRTGGQK